MKRISKVIISLPLLATAMVYANPASNTASNPFKESNKIAPNVGNAVSEVANTAKVEAINVTKPIPRVKALSIANIKNVKGLALSYMLKVRAKPWGETVDIVKQGDTVEIVGNEDDWFIVDYNCKKGYVHSSWVEVEGYDYTIPTTGFLLDDVSYYNEKGDAIGKLDDDKEIEILADAGAFWKIRLDSSEYFVLKDSVDSQPNQESDGEDDSSSPDNLDDNDGSGDKNEGPYVAFLNSVDDFLDEDVDEEKDNVDVIEDKKEAEDVPETKVAAVSPTVPTTTYVAPQAKTRGDDVVVFDSPMDTNIETKKVEPKTTTTSTSTKTATTSKSTTVAKTTKEEIQTTTSVPKLVNVTLNGKKYSLPGGDKVYFLDVADVPKNWGVEKGSDCIIIESQGKFGMIDVGMSGSLMDTTARIMRYVKDLGIKKLDFLLITHTHGDHDGGLKKLVNSGIKIKTMYIKNDGGRYKDDVKYGKKAGATIYNVEKHKSTKFTLGNMKFELFNTKRNSYSKNVNSIVALATVSGKRILFGGDMESPSKGTKYADNVAKEIGKIDLYKVAHHGFTSPSSGGKNNSVVSLGYYKPKYAVCTNTERRLKKSKSQVISRLKKHLDRKNLYFTGDGTVILNVDPKGNFTFKKLPANK